MWDLIKIHSNVQEKFKGEIRFSRGRTQVPMFYVLTENLLNFAKQFQGKNDLNCTLQISKFYGGKPHRLPFGLEGIKPPPPPPVLGCTCIRFEKSWGRGHLRHSSGGGGGGWASWYLFICLFTVIHTHSMEQRHACQFITKQYKLALVKIRYSISLKYVSIIRQ